MSKEVSCVTRGRSFLGFGKCFQNSSPSRPENISLIVETDRSPPHYTMYYYRVHPVIKTGKIQICWIFRPWCISSYRLRSGCIWFVIKFFRCAISFSCCIDRWYFSIFRSIFYPLSIKCLERKKIVILWQMNEIVKGWSFGVTEQWRVAWRSVRGCCRQR